MAFRAQIEWPCRTVLGRASPSARPPLQRSHLCSSFSETRAIRVDQFTKGDEVEDKETRFTEYQRSFRYSLHPENGMVGAGLSFCIFHWGFRKIHIVSKLRYPLYRFQSPVFCHIMHSQGLLNLENTTICMSVASLVQQRESLLHWLHGGRTVLPPAAFPGCCEMKRAVLV